MNFISFDSVVFYIQSAFGDVYVPDEFEPPSVQTIAAFTKKSHGVSSAPLKVLDAKTLLLPDFTYNGAGKGKIGKRNKVLIHYTRVIFYFKFMRSPIT